MQFNLEQIYKAETHGQALNSQKQADDDEFYQLMQDIQQERQKLDRSQFMKALLHHSNPPKPEEEANPYENKVRITNDSIQNELNLQYQKLQKIKQKRLEVSEQQHAYYEAEKKSLESIRDATKSLERRAGIIDPVDGNIIMLVNSLSKLPTKSGPGNSAFTEELDRIALQNRMMQ